ncbi:hypothetical protein CRG98_002907 [Punica granatum]|uniref:Uncharacterized protein n=1 Tax=Punica granatum TaxID=22663 RepID=A0A2I0L7B7_PUNGR|nr:hypothetical protein CRG98_002907 [Punica granatum]
MTEVGSNRVDSGSGREGRGGGQDWDWGFWEKSRRKKTNVGYFFHTRVRGINNYEPAFYFWYQTSLVWCGLLRIRAHMIITMVSDTILNFIGLTWAWAQVST